MRTLDVATQGAIRDRSRIVPRNFVLIMLASGTEYGFTDFGEDVLTNVIDGETGATVSHTYYGDHAPILSMDPIPLKIGLSVDTTQIVLNPLHPQVADLVRGHQADLRNAAVQIHRGYLDPASMLLVAAPRCRRLGQVNRAPIDTAPAGDQSTVTLEIVSTTRELTRTNPATKSDEVQKLRNGGGDRFRQYAGTAYQWDIRWGQASGG